MEEKEINNKESSQSRELTLEEKNALLRKARAEQKNARIEERNKRFAEMVNQINVSQSAASEANTENEKPEDHSDNASAADTTPTEDVIPEPTAPIAEDESAKKDNCEKKRAKKNNDRSPFPTFPVLSLILSTLSLIFVAVIILTQSAEMLPPTNVTEIVYINVSDSTDINRDPEKGEDIAGYSDMLENAMNSVVIVTAAQNNGTDSTGTGIILSNNGYILTNFHVISGSSQVRVKFKGSDSYTDADVIGYKIHDDIAVIKVDMTDLPAATLGKSANCRVGDRVFAIGCPQGADYAWSVTQGIISAPDRDLKIYDLSTGIVQKKMKVIQTDTPVNPGNSGGPLIDASGRVLGIISLKLTDTSGMGFALPIDEVMTMVEGIISNKSGNNVESTIASGRPLLGITGVAVQKGTYYADAGDRLEIVTSAYAENHPDSTFYCSVSGVLVRGATKGTDAAKKLKNGDIITQINGIDIVSIADVSLIINDLYGGDSVEITYSRDGDIHKISLILSEAEIQ